MSQASLTRLTSRCLISKANAVPNRCPFHEITRSWEKPSQNAAKQPWAATGPGVGAALFRHFGERPFANTGNWLTEVVSRPGPSPLATSCESASSYSLLRRAAHGRWTCCWPPALYGWGKPDSLPGQTIPGTSSREHSFSQAAVAAVVAHRVASRGSTAFPGSRP